MKWLAALACLALPVHAGSVTATAPSCPSHNGFVVDAVGNLTITCTGTPPIITPPVNPVPGCPAVANLKLLPAGTSGLGLQLRDFTPGYTFSVPLPKNATAFHTTRNPDTPPSLNVEVTVSKCPGDVRFWTDPSEIFHYSFLPTTPFYPCNGSGSAESAGLWVSPTLGQNTCQITTTEQWYANIRLVGPDGSYSCPPASAYGPGCSLLYWWN